MGTKTIHAGIQIGANNPVIQRPVDRNLLSLVKNKTEVGKGWSQADTDSLVRSGALNDQPPANLGRNGDEYGNVTEGNVIRPMLAKAADMRKKVVLDGTEFKFTSLSSRDHFKSEMGRWFAENAKPKA